VGCRAAEGSLHIPTLFTQASHRAFVFLLHFSSACVTVETLSGQNDNDERGGDDNNTTKTTTRTATAPSTLARARA
jgi:hypothetical protein